MQTTVVIRITAGKIYTWSRGIKRTWMHFLARHGICINNYILLQFPKEMNTRGSKTPTSFTPFHTDFLIIKASFFAQLLEEYDVMTSKQY